MQSLVAKIHGLEAVADCIRGFCVMLFYGDDLSPAYLSRSCFIGFRHGVFVRILGLPRLVRPVLLFSVDVAAQHLCDGLDGTFDAAVCWWNEVDGMCTLKA